MKKKIKITSLIDKQGFGINLIPVVYIGYENYSYSKVLMFYVSWFFWEFTLELHY
ncbi:hypothetical protein [Flavobacterium sp. WC2509]|uniref:hypothetical protein n=1 Tax=Flavobacterium sp. WC2509 TaxID=3461406 RepID=UPI004043EA7F